jgi:hypothetical protein
LKIIKEAKRENEPVEEEKGDGGVAAQGKSGPKDSRCFPPGSKRRRLGSDGSGAFCGEKRGKERGRREGLTASVEEDDCQPL